MTSQAADLFGKRFGQAFEPPLEGAPAGEASLLTKQFAHHLHLRCRFVEDRQELSHFVQPPDDRDHRSLQEKLLRVNGGPSPAAAAARWRWRTRDALYKSDQLDKDAVVSDHGRASEESVFGHSPSSEVSRLGASPDEVFYL